MAPFDRFLDLANTFLWQNTVLFIILGTGIVFTIWTRFCQFRALSHGVQVPRGRYDRASDRGAITHFQALSAALSATVGIGNIGGVALAITLGGPGARLMLFVNIPVMWLMGRRAMGAYRDYMQRRAAGCRSGLRRDHY